jgi:hypothetical protein
MPKVIFAEDREVFHLMVYSRFLSEQTSPKRRQQFSKRNVRGRAENCVKSENTSLCVGISHDGGRYFWDIVHS